MEAGRCHFHILLLLHPRASFSLRGELLYISSSLVFAAATQGTPVDHQVLEARGLAFLCTV